jgi:hypothetical protein
VLPTVIYGCLIATAIALWAGRPFALQMVAGTLLFLLLLGIRDAWIWRRGFPIIATTAERSGRIRLDGERMHSVGDLAGKRFVNHPVRGNPGFAPEGRCRDLHAEMTFSACPVTGVTLVKVGFVHHFEVIRGKNLG